MLTTVLFDLDGTLLPMDQDAFVNGYLKLMIQKMAPYGYSPEKLIGCIWKGTQAMYANSGAETNEALFWSIFEDSFGKKGLADQPLLEDFYRNEFQQAAQCCGFDPRAREAVDAIHAMGLTTALATNPLFPAVATESREPLMRRASSAASGWLPLEMNMYSSAASGFAAPRSLRTLPLSIFTASAVILSPSPNRSFGSKEADIIHCLLLYHISPSSTTSERG